MEKFNNIPELGRLIELIKSEDGGEHRLAVIRRHNHSTNIAHAAAYLEEKFPFNSFSKSTILRATYFIVNEDEITTNNYDYDCSDMNDFTRKSVEFLYNTKNTKNAESEEDENEFRDDNHSPVCNSGSAVHWKLTGEIFSKIFNICFK